VIDAPLDQTFVFFSKAANLGVITPAAMRFSIQGQPPPMAAGAVIAQIGRPPRGGEHRHRASSPKSHRPQH
jgi:hypothetical protein